jgi:hypothetical protein
MQSIITPFCLPQSILPKALSPPPSPKATLRSLSLSFSLSLYLSLSLSIYLSIYLSLSLSLSISISISLSISLSSLSLFLLLSLPLLLSLSPLSLSLSLALCLPTTSKFILSLFYAVTGSVSPASVLSAHSRHPPSIHRKREPFSLLGLRASPSRIAAAGTAGARRRWSRAGRSGPWDACHPHRIRRAGAPVPASASPL